MLTSTLIFTASLIAKSAQMVKIFEIIVLLLLLCFN